MDKNTNANTPVMMNVRMKVFNADGTLKKDYGVVNYWHKNPFKRIAFKIKQFFKKESS